MPLGAFSVAGPGPTVWNSLPGSVRSAETLVSFKRNLKIYLFNISFQLAFITYNIINTIMHSHSVFAVGWALD